jgi:hypothetical protein
MKDRQSARSLPARLLASLARRMPRRFAKGKTALMLLATYKCA